MKTRRVVAVLTVLTCCSLFLYQAGLALLTFYTFPTARRVAYRPLPSVDFPRLQVWTRDLQHCSVATAESVL